MTDREKHERYWQMYNNIQEIEEKAETATVFDVKIGNRISKIEPTKIHCFFMSVADEEAGRYFLDFEYVDKTGYHRIYRNDVEYVVPHIPMKMQLPSDLDTIEDFISYNID